MTEKSQQARNAFIEGPIGRTLFAFSLPILLSSVLQSLNASINAAWIGRLLGERALTAGANANTLVFLLLGTLFGLGMAASVLIGQALGGKNIDLAKRTIGTGITLFGLAAIVLSSAGIAFAPHVLRAMRTPPDALPYAVSYLRVIFTAMPGMFLYTFLMMAMRGAGDAKTPFVFLCFSTLIDVSLNPLLICGLGPIPAMGVAGSALASAIAQWVSLLAFVSWIYSKRHFLRLTRGELHYLRLDREIARSLVVKGVPMGLQMVLISASMVAMISLVNGYGSRVTAAYGVCFQLWNYIQMPAFSVGGAVSAMAAQNIGADRWDRVARITHAGILLNVVMTTGLILVLTVVNRPVLSMFLGGSTDAVDIGVHIHRVVSWSFILFGVSVVLSSTVRATGAVTVPLVILFIAVWLVRIPFAAALAPAMHADSIWWSFPLGAVTSLAMTMIYYRFGKWREARMLPAGVAVQRAA